MKKVLIPIAFLFIATYSKAQSAKEFGLKGKVAEVIEITNEGILSATNHDPVKRITKFDNEGYIISDNEYFLDGALAKKRRIKKSNDSERVEYEYNSHDTLLSKTTYTYNALHQVIKMTSVILHPFVKSDPVMEKFLKNKANPPLIQILKYDNTGNKIEVDSYFDDKLDHKILYKYDNAGRLISEDEFSIKRNTIGSHKTFGYDAADHMTSSKGYFVLLDKRTESTNAFQKFDKYGNWLEQAYKSEDNNFRVSRAIKYY
jgi:hypothetical protein